MDMNFAVFQEPRGVMRIIQFIFSICAFATTCNYSGFIDFNCDTVFNYRYAYPFNLEYKETVSTNKGACHPNVTILGDFSSDAKFFVATGVISMLYCLAIIVVYIKFDEMYKTNNQIPLFDFLLSVFIAVLWLSSSASWANGLTGLKHVTDVENIHWDLDKVDKSCSIAKCPISISSFSSLDISVILGFLNFFLWAADLWFLYKETTWFQNARVATPTEN